MKKAEQTEQCAHGMCDCPVDMSGNYCSDYCENADTNPTDDAECKCGHPECG